MTRREFALAGLAAGGALALPALAGAESGPDFFNVIRERHSVRAYADEPVSDADVETMLRCAMQAPSAANEQPWDFIVIRDRDLLDQAAGINPWAGFVRKAPLAILVCLNGQKEKEKGMGIIDMGACSENLLLAATALGLGAVFTGIYPLKDRMEGFSRLCGLPDYVQPIGLIVIGKPKGEAPGFKDRYNPAAVHQNRW